MKRVLSKIHGKIQNFNVLCLYQFMTPNVLERLFLCIDEDRYITDGNFQALPERQRLVSLLLQHDGLMKILIMSITHSRT